jgi:hypothetical protein
MAFRFQIDSCRLCALSDQLMSVDSARLQEEYDSLAGSESAAGFMPNLQRRRVAAIGEYAQRPTVREFSSSPGIGDSKHAPGLTVMSGHP